jgi:FkbH-like protein
VKLAEALWAIQTASPEAASYTVLLACGFSPLHLQTFLAAHLQHAFSGKKVSVTTGLYDDPAGTLEQIGQSGAQAGAFVLEWADLDPRLGYRNLGGWGERLMPGILEAVERKLQRLEAAIERKPASFKLAVSLPTLPLMPAFHTAGWQASSAEIALEAMVATFAAHAAKLPSVVLVNQKGLEARSAPDARYDFRADLHNGFPYTLKHADSLAEALAKLIQPPQPKKGLITDLDDTLWLGIVGEDGADQVSWDLASHSQLHGLYQQMLNALADQGVLVGIASKNSPEAVERALSRTDLVLARERVFPIEVHWEAKSGSVGRILKAWNVGAESVVFVDDSPMELEEVRAVYPAMECILFPKSNYAAGFAMLGHLRDLFGKAALSEEDSYRLESIRQNRLFAEHHFAEQNGQGDLAEQFLSTVEATITIEFGPPASDKRALELVNKTNQFNLNGIRFTEAEWHEKLSDPLGFVAVLAYQDKFGPLGKIAVVAGKQEDPTRLYIDTWVMSCRAFSRRIEHQCLARLFERFGTNEMRFHFQSTPKNAPLQELLASLLDQPPGAETCLTRASFSTKCPKLYQKVIETT